MDLPFDIIGRIATVSPATWQLMLALPTFARFSVSRPGRKMAKAAFTKKIIDGDVTVYLMHGLLHRDPAKGPALAGSRFLFYMTHGELSFRVRYPAVVLAGRLPRHGPFLSMALVSPACEVVTKYSPAITTAAEAREYFLSRPWPRGLLRTPIDWMYLMDPTMTPPCAWSVLTVTRCHYLVRMTPYINDGVTRASIALIGGHQNTFCCNNYMKIPDFSRTMREMGTTALTKKRLLRRGRANSL